jgi:hypothetical protein
METIRFELKIAHRTRPILDAENERIELPGALSVDF